MTGSLRSSARNPVAVVLMGLLILVFLLLGVGTGGRLPDVLNGARADSVVTAGHHAVTSSEFRKIFDQQKQRLEQQNGATYTPEFLAKNNFDQQILASMAQDQAISEMLSRAGIAPASPLIDAIIKKIPAAFDRVTGKFSEVQFNQFLAVQGLTLRDVTNTLTDQIAQQHFASAVADGMQVPRAYAAVQALAGLQNRDVSYFMLSPQTLAKPAPPTDAQLLAFEKANAAQLMRPEMRTITMARFSADAVAPSIKIDQAQVANAFNDRRASLSSAETRTVVQIPVTSGQAAQAALQALSAGQDPTAIARALHVEPILYDDKPQTAVADRKIGAAAFAMKAGEVRGVQGDLGAAVVKVIHITPAHTPTLETERVKIEADLRQKAAQDQAYKQSEAFDQARQSGLSVAAAAQKVGAPTIQVGPFTATGVGVDGKPVTLINDKIAKSAFTANAGEDTDIADAGPGDYFALHLDKVTPPALPSLADARPQLVQQWTMQQLGAAFRAKAEGLEAQIRAGKPLAQVAASVGSHVQQLAGMQLLKAKQYEPLGRDFLTAAFGTKAGDTFASGAPGGAFIGKVDAVRPADQAQAASVINAVRGRLGSDYAKDLLEAARAASERSVRVSLNRPLALKSLNLDPKNFPATGPAKAGGRQAQ